MHIKWKIRRSARRAKGDINSVLLCSVIAHMFGFNGLKPIKKRVKTIPGHTTFDPQNMVRFGQT